jgi:hypothetical protein
MAIMWGRDKNFQVSMLYELKNRENKIYAGFAFPPFVLQVVRRKQMGEEYNIAEGSIRLGSMILIN